MQFGNNSLGKSNLKIEAKCNPNLHHTLGLGLTYCVKQAFPTLGYALHHPMRRCHVSLLKVVLLTLT